MGTGFGGLDEFFSLDQGMQDLWIGHWFNRRNGRYDVDKKAEVKQTTEEAIAAERAWMEKRRAKND